MMLMFLFKICYRVNSIFKQVEYCLNLLSTIFKMQESLIERITIDPEICHGKPTIRGLRYPVDSILEYLAAGDSIEDI